MEETKKTPRTKRPPSDPDYNPVYDGDYTLEDYRREWSEFLQSGGEQFQGISKEWREFADMLESPLSEHPEEWAVYLEIHKEAMERWPDKRTWEDFDIDDTLKRTACLGLYYEVLEADKDKEKAIQEEIQRLNNVAEAYEKRSQYVPTMLQFIEEHPDYLEAATVVYAEVQKEEAKHTKEPPKEINEKTIAYGASCNIGISVEFEGLTVEQAIKEHYRAVLEEYQRIKKKGGRRRSAEDLPFIRTIDYAKGKTAKPHIWDIIPRDMGNQVLGNIETHNAKGRMTHQTNLDEGSTDYIVLINAINNIRVNSTIITGPGEEVTKDDIEFITAITNLQLTEHPEIMSAMSFSRGLDASISRTDRQIALALNGGKEADITPDMIKSVQMEIEKLSRWKIDMDLRPLIAVHPEILETLKEHNPDKKQKITGKVVSNFLVVGPHMIETEGPTGTAYWRTYPEINLKDWLPLLINEVTPYRASIRDTPKLGPAALSPNVLETIKGLEAENIILWNNAKEVKEGAEPYIFYSTKDHKKNVVLGTVLKDVALLDTYSERGTRYMDLDLDQLERDIWGDAEHPRPAILDIEKEKRTPKSSTSKATIPNHKKKILLALCYVLQEGEIGGLDVIKKGQRWQTVRIYSKDAPLDDLIKKRPSKTRGIISEEIAAKEKKILDTDRGKAQKKAAKRT